MQITTNELALISSVVAVAAVAGGYLGVRSANNTAVAIARDERAARRQSEIDNQRRIAYSSFLAALSQLADDQIQLDIATRQAKTNRDELWLNATNSARIANDGLANLFLIAPESIRVLANAAFNHALKASDNDIKILAEEGDNLAGAMRDDLYSEMRIFGT